MTPAAYVGIAERLDHLRADDKATYTITFTQPELMAVTTAIRSHAITLGRTDGERAGRFMRWYAEAYAKYRSVHYCNSPALDYAAAVTLCAAYPDSTRLKQITEVFLQIDEARDVRFKGKTRTVAFLRSMASAIEERLVKAEILS